MEPRHRWHDMGRGAGRPWGRGEDHHGHHDEGPHGPGPERHGRPAWEGRGRGGGRPGGPPFGGPPFGGFGGRRFGRGPHVGRGDVRTAALALLAEQPLHGYQIIQQITERSGGIWRPSAGSVYPALQLLEDEGLVRAEQVESRRVFHLTGTGRTYVDARREELAAVFAAVTDTVDTESRALRDLYEQVGAAVKQVSHAGTQAQITEAQQLLTTTRRQLYRILADVDPAEDGTPTKV